MKHGPEDTPRIERLILLAERLVAVLEADIAALTAGKPGEMKSLDPENQKLSVIYGKEAQNFDIRIAKSAPPGLRQRFMTITTKFREVLQLHTRLLARVRNASEGMIQAVAREVERINAPSRNYGPQSGYKAQAAGPMLFNRVV